MPEPQINTGTSLDSVIGNIKDPTERAILKDETSRENKVQEFTEKKIAEKDAIESPRPPVLEKSPDPRDYVTDPMQTFGSAAMFLAAFGGLLTKKPLETALNSGAAVMNAANNRDAASFNKAFNKWKIDSDNAWKMADWNQQKYKDAIGKSDEDVKLYAQMFKNDTAAHALTARMHEQDLKSQQKALDKAQGATGAIIDYVNSKEQEAKDSGKSEAYIDANRIKWYGEAKALGSGKGNSEIDPEKYTEWKAKNSSVKDADAYANGAPIANFMRARGKDSGEQLQMIKDLAAERHPDYDRNQAVQDYSAAMKAVSGFGDGKHGDMARSFGVSYSHINLLSGLAKALNNGDVKKINALSQDYEEQFGSPAPTNFDSAKRILSDEINKAVVGSAGALTDREGIAANVNRANSFAQIEGSLDTFKGLILGQVNGLKRQYEHTTKRKDFDTILDPDVAGDLKKYEDKKERSPDARHIKMLKDDPSDQNKRYFDEAFGEGSAAKALGE